MATGGGNCENRSVVGGRIRNRLRRARGRFGAVWQSIRRIPAGIGLANATGVSFGGVPVKWSGPRALVLLFAIAGAVALIDGFSLAVKEEARATYGCVVSAWVTSRYRMEGMLTTWVVD